MSELHDDLERASTALKKEPITDELVVACEHILCRPDLPISTPDVHLPPLDNAETAHLSRYRTTRRLKMLSDNYSCRRIASREILPYRVLLKSLTQSVSCSV